MPKVRHRFAAPLLGMTLSLLLSAAAFAAAAPEVDQYTLDNGLRVVVIPDHRTPVVVHSVWYNVGSADDPLGQSGLAHFLEHLMFRGTKAVPAGEFSKTVAKNGGQENAFTYLDYTGYYQMVAKDRLPLMMKLEADRMANLQLTDAVVLPERKVIIEERRMRTDNQPDALLYEQMEALQFVHHPYGTPVIGWQHEMAGLTREEALAFYDHHYAPNNAILIVVGDVTGDEVLKLAREYYGPVEKRDVWPRNRVQEPPQRAPRSVTLTSKDVSQPTWRRSYYAPSAHAGDVKAAPALEVLAQYLGGGTLSQLYRQLVVKEKIAAGTAAFYSAESYDPTTFGLYAAPAPGTSLDALEAAVDREIEKVKAGEIDDAALARAKTLLKASVTYSRDSIMSLMQTYGTVLTAGLDVSYVANWAGTIDAVTRDDVIAAAKEVLDPKNAVTGRLLPEPASQGASAPAEQQG
jgi:zinc protease